MATMTPIIDFKNLTKEQQAKIREISNVYGLERLSGEPLTFREYHVLKMALRGLFGDYEK